MPTKTSMHLPPGPTVVPTLQLVSWIVDPLSYLEQNFARFGDIFTARWLNLSPFIIISHPQYVQQILTADPRCFDSGAGATLLKPILGEHSLLLLDGEPHQRQRKLMMPSFHGERLRAYGETIVEISHHVFGQGNQAPTPVRSVMQKISLRLILQVVFGLQEGERYTQLEALLSSMVEATASPLRSSMIFLPGLQIDGGKWTPWGRFVRQRREIDRLIYAEITERHDREPGTDILSLLMSARDENGAPMTQAELRDQLLTLLVAGHETTASSLAWCLYLIDRHPEVKQQLMEEISTCNPHDIDTISKLPYLAAVCQETLRIYPIAILTEPRIPRAPFTLGNYTFPVGTILAPCIYLLHRRSDTYPNPTAFRPERFLTQQFSPYEYLPFGGGGRRCIGAAFALYEMKLVLFTLLYHYQVTIKAKGLVKPMRRGVTVAPSGNLFMVMAAR